jgi:hypothetical protein
VVLHFLAVAARRSESLLIPGPPGAEETCLPGCCPQVQGPSGGGLRLSGESQQLRPWNGPHLSIFWTWSLPSQAQTQNRPHMGLPHGACSFEPLQWRCLKMQAAWQSEGTPPQKQHRSSNRAQLAHLTHTSVPAGF